MKRASLPLRNRREFIALIGGAAAAWPLAARAQQPAMPVIGFLRSASLADATHLMAGFRQGLKEAGFVEGRNVAVEYLSAEGQNDRLPALIADLIGRRVSLIVVNAIAARAVKTATRSCFSPRQRGRSGWSCCANWCQE
jgi:ABC-type sugar transport system substrate-binding protein